MMIAIAGHPGANPAWQHGSRTVGRPDMPPTVRLSAAADRLDLPALGT